MLTAQLRQNSGGAKAPTVAHGLALQHVQCCSTQWRRQGDTEGDRISGQHESRRREIPMGEGVGGMLPQEFFCF